MKNNREQARTARRARHEAIRTAVAQEEAETAVAEAAENAALLDVPLHLRIDQELHRELRCWAQQEQISTSVLVRKILRQATQAGSNLTAADVEAIARRVAREEMQSA